MATAWSAEQVLALAPDPAAAKAGRELSTPRKWVSRGSRAHVLWGECQGSGATPYQTIIAPNEPAFRCSCPSRKFPCKHALGLFLLWANDPNALAEAEPPAWVVSWLEGRAERVEKKAQARPKESAGGDSAARARREKQRWDKVNAGAQDLGLWIQDLARGGLAGLQAQRQDVWEEQGRRLIDAQAPGLARRVRALEAVPVSGHDWHAPLLDRLARLHLAVEACRRFDALVPDLKDELRGVLGMPVDQDSVRAGPGVRDVWQIVGQRVEIEERLRTQRTWLIGRDTGQMALVLDFAFGAGQPLDTSLPAGAQVEADLAFFPAAVPLRALVKARHAPPEAIAVPRAWATIRQACAAYADVLARSPWVEAVPLVLADVRLIPGDSTWTVHDAEGRALPVAPRFGLGWQCLGLTGGHATMLSGEYDGATFDPLACWYEGRVIRLSGEPAEAAGAVATTLTAPAWLDDLWREAAASALVGTDRKPPPTPSALAAVYGAVSQLESLDPPARLLGLAACLTQYLRVGCEPALSPVAPPEPAPPEGRPECTPAQAERLRRMLAGEHADALGEWLALADASGRRVPGPWIGNVFSLARRRSDLRAPLRDAVGQRGRWLAALNPEWSGIITQAEPGNPNAAWETGTRPERLAALRALRDAEPARGLALLESTWSAEPADDRAAFLGALAAGLGPDDEPFLERALDDRGKTVRREAADLLARLPESAFAGRMAGRAIALLRWDGNTLVVEPPAACDAAMVRDGLVTKPPARVGERAWWLQQIVAAAPVSCWEPAVGLAPETLVARARATEWGTELWVAWARAAARSGDARWAAALLGARPVDLVGEEVVGGLLAVLTSEARDAFLLDLLRKHAGRLGADHPAWPFLQQLDAPLGRALAEELLGRLREAVAEDESAARPRYDSELAAFVPRLGTLLPASLADDFDGLWPPAEGERVFYSTAIDQLKALLRFRHELHQEFAP